MKTYRSHKTVKAVKCSEIRRVPQEDGSHPQLQADDMNLYAVDANIFARGEPTGAFYIVEYEDGYRSWSPAEAFEKGYKELVSIEYATEEDLFNDFNARLFFHQSQIDALLSEGLEKKFLSDPRLVAVAKTDIQKGFIVARHILQRPRKIEDAAGLEKE